jgi:chromate transporter
MINVFWQMNAVRLLHLYFLCLERIQKGGLMMPEKFHQVPGVQSSPSMLVSSPGEGGQLVEGASTPTLWSLFLVWSKISVLAFGGGSSTLLLMRQEFVERQRWLTGEEYARFWGLGQLSPGTNLIAMVILMGRFLGGGVGIVVSLVGLLLPSATIDSILAAGFLLVQTLRPVQAIIQGVVPATAGVMLTVAIQFARPQVVQSYRTGFIRFTECLLIITGSTVALIFVHIEDFVVILAAGGVSLAVFLPGETFVKARKIRRKESNSLAQPSRLSQWRVA